MGKNAGKEACEINILIPKKLYESTMSDYSITTYCLLKNLYMYSPSFSECVTLQNLIYHLTESVPDRRNAIYNHVQLGIEELNDNGYIHIIDIKQKHYILDCSNLHFDTSSGCFSNISFEEVKKIFQIKGVNNYCLLRYFILLMGTLAGKITVMLPDGNSKSGVVSNLPISYLAKQMGVSDKTIMDYNKLLEDAKLIYVYRQNDFMLDKNNSIKSLSNIYGRYEDKEYIDTFALNQRNHNKAHRYTDKKYNDANQKRRLAQMYQNIYKGKYDNYSDDEIVSIYEYVISENNKYKELYKTTKYDDYLNKIRDVSVFDRFDFIKK